ncbi:MAG: hypothetical protein WDZ76_02950 [Pseudohongiellaceae bacterium]
MKISILFIPALILSACAASPEFYRPAEGPGALGYSEVRLTEDRYRVSFVGDNTTTSTAVKDLALLRAAELTLMENRDWFQIVTEESAQASRNTPQTTRQIEEGRQVIRDCGPLGCTTTVAPSYSGVQVITTRDADRYATTVEIVMGEGEVQNPTTVYNAAELYDNLEDMYGA